MPSQEVRALLAARKQMQIKAMDLEQTLRGLLRGFGLKVGDVSRGKLAARIRELVSGHAMLERIAEPMLTAREALWSEFAKLHREVLAIVKGDTICRRLMTVPGVGAVVSLTYRAGVDDPTRFAKSKSVGAFFGLTPKRYQSGEMDVTGAITKVGDAGVRTALHDAANALLTRATKFSIAQAVGTGRCQAAGKCAGRRWRWHVGWPSYCIGSGVDGTEFVWGKDPAAEAAA